VSLIERIRAAGVEIAADGNRLLARGVMTPEQRAWLTDHKAELLAELRGARPMVEYRSNLR
jgi:hypothetical protein